MMLHTILVTGGAGFIGSNFIRYLLKLEPDIQIVNLDVLSYSGSLENLKGLPDVQRHIFVHGDICDRGLVDDLMHRYRINIIIHFAAETHVDRSILDPGKFIQTNVVGTYTLLEAARKYWLEDISFPVDTIRFHHISTDEVFGSLAPNDPPWTEATPYAPNSPYAASKAASDHLVRSYGHTYGLPYSITNCTNNYGPYQFPEKLIPLMILNARDGKPLPVYGDGGQIRDWLHVEDHCEAIWLVVTKGKAGETYGIGGGAQPTNLAIVNQICGILDELRPNSSYVPHISLIRYVADRPGHDRRYAIDHTKVTRELGWNPRHNLGQGLQETVEWYLANNKWLHDIQQQTDYQSWMAKNYGNRDEIQ